MNDLIGRFKKEHLSPEQIAGLLDRSSEIKDIVAASTEQARELLKYDIAEQLSVLPLVITKNSKERGGIDDSSGYRLDTLVVAAATATDPVMQKTLSFITDHNIKIIEVNGDTIKRAIFSAYYGDDLKLAENIKVANASSENTFFDNRVPSLWNARQVNHGTQAKTLLSNDQSYGAVILRSLLDYAIARGASDLHIYPQPDSITANLRLNGMLYTHEGNLCSHTVYNQIVSITKVAAGLDTTIHHRSQDGSFPYKVSAGEINIRVSLMPTVNGEKLVFRFLGIEQLRKLKDIKMHRKAHDFIERFMRQHDGLCLFAGPTGSGKSTTMYAVIEELKGRNLSISTIENPVEVRISGLAQTELDTKRGMDYANCLKGVLRQDPDVILLGEIRDRTSANAAIQATQTGHLILSTIHGRNVFDCLKRLQVLGADPTMIGDSVKLLIFQRLIPALCQRCKVLDLNVSRIAMQYKQLDIKRIYQPGSCRSCDFTGYSGRLLAVEALYVDDAVSEILVKGNLDKESLKPVLSDKNYLSLEASIRRLLEDGEVTMEGVG